METPVRFEQVPGGLRIKTEGGWHLQVKPMMRGFRLLELREGSEHDFGRYWCYPTFQAAALAALAWEVTESSSPVGWTMCGGARS